MGKEKNPSTVTRLTKEKMSKLSPEELAEYASSLAAEADGLKSTADNLQKANVDLEKDNEAKTSKLKALEKKAKKERPVTFEIEESDDKNGEYEFTAPTLTWDDNNVYDIRKLSESNEKADTQLFDEICAKLVQRNSGLVRRKGD